MSNEKWVMRWRSWIAPKPSKPGVWRRKEGGFLVRGRAMDPRTGRMHEVRMTLVDVDAAGAYARLQDELRKARAGTTESAAPKIRFSDYAVSLLERKVQAGEIKSAQTRELWGCVLRRHLLPAFGAFFVDQIRRADVEAWRGGVAAAIQGGAISPHTANDRLAVLRVIVNAAVAELELERNPVMGVRSFDTTDHPTYTEEEPNSLTPEEMPRFLAALRARHPQHFAFVALGFATGLRPSSLRPLRRKGATPDVLWDEGAILVRRSHTRRREVMETTKTRIRQRIALPQEMMDILRWHADGLPDGPMRESDLLFPSAKGGYRATTCLVKPFRDVAKTLGLAKRITPRAMRRTFQDLARAAEVKDVVTRAISGHATEDMQRHYSTVHAEEIRQGLARVLSLARFKEALGSAPGSGGVQGGVHAPKTETAGTEGIHNRP